MKKTNKCPKCGSQEVVADAHMLDRAHANHKRDLQAATYENPDALIFKGEHLFTLKAWICVECGYTEIYSTRKR